MKSKLHISIIAMLMGLLIYFFGHQIPIIKSFDFSCAHFLADDDSLVAAKNDPRQAITSAHLQKIAITDDPERIFESTPPSPLDYAVILDRLLEHGHRDVIFNTPLVWDDYSEIELQALNRKLTSLDSVTLSLPLTRGVINQAAPPALQQSLIPLNQVQGNYHPLPRANQVTLTQRADGGANTLAGFSVIESAQNAEDTEHVQLIALWQGQAIVPSTELLVLMKQHEVPLKDLIILCGKEIRFGEKGPMISIDEFGRTPIRNSLSEDTQSVDIVRAQDLFDQEKPYQKMHDTVIIHTLDSHAGNHLVATNQKNSNQLSRLPAWAEIAILFDLALILFFIMNTRPHVKILGTWIIICLIVFSIITFISLIQLWYALSAPLTIIAVNHLLSIGLKRRTQPVNE